MNRTKVGIFAKSITRNFRLASFNVKTGHKIFWLKVYGLSKYIHVTSILEYLH